jgi:hypothetical protein
MFVGVGIAVGVGGLGSDTPPPPASFSTTLWETISSPFWESITDTWT